MNMEKQHLRIKQLLERSDATNGDVEREALFHILAGNDDLFAKVNYIYNFAENIIKVDCLDGEVDFSSSSIKLIKLGYNLFNGYEVSVVDVFGGLDEDNSKLALDAIKIRFNID